MYALLLPFWVLCIQFAFHALSLKGVEKQNECLILGIIITTIGIVSLVSRDVVFTVSGFVLMMFGFRLISTGLDRIDKRKFPDRHE